MNRVRPFAPRTFKEPEMLALALNMRRIGWSFTSIGLMFGCTRKSVEQQCNKYLVKRIGPDLYSIERIIAAVLPKQPPSRWALVAGERVNLGRSYKDYFKNGKVPDTQVSFTISP